MREVLLGQTDYTVLVKIMGTDGAPETGLAHTDIDIAYSRVETDNDVTTADVAPADLASLTAAHSDWGWEEVSSTDHPGLYRLDIADAVFASGAWEAVVTITDASGTEFEAVDIGFRLIGIDKTAAAWQANVTQFGGSNGTFSGGRPEVNTTHAAGTAWGSGAITAGSIASDAITAAKIATGAIDADAIADNAIDAGAIATGAITSAKFAAGAIDAAAIANGAIDAATFAADVDAEILSYLVDDATRIDASALNTATATTIPGINTATAAIQAAISGLVIYSDVLGATGNDTTHANLTLPSGVGNDEINGCVIVIQSSGEFATRYIADWVDSSDLATLSSALPWSPSAGDAFWVLSLNIGHIRTELTTELARIDAAVSSRSSHTAANVRTEMDSNSTQLATIAADVVNLDGAAMRGTDNAALAATALSTATWTSTRAGYLDNLSAGAVATAAALTSAAGDITTILGKFTGITLLAQWLGLIAGKQTGNSTARTELRATGAGSGTFDETTDSQEALRDRGDAAWVTGGGGTGSGARTVTITVNDGSTALESARVRMTKGAENYVGSTNASGVIVFSLDDGTWSVAISLPGYQFTPTTRVVDGTETQTYSMTLTTLDPSEPGRTTGYIYCYGEDGELESGVTIRIVSAAPTGSGVAYDSTERSETSSAGGLVQFTNLFKGQRYVMYRGTSTRPYNILIPSDAGATYLLPSIAGGP